MSGSQMDPGPFLRGRTEFASAAMLAELTRSFIQVLRSGHPGVPLTVLTPIARPDAEMAANGASLVPADALVDGIHPGDTGHQSIAAAVTRALRAARLPASPTRPEEYAYEA